MLVHRRFVMNRRTVIIYGMGGYFKNYEEQLFENYNIVAIADKDDSKRGQYRNIPVISPTQIKEYGDVEVLIVMKFIDFSILSDLLANSIELSRIHPFFRPGYLNPGDYSASFTRDHLVQNKYAIKIDIKKYGISFYLRNHTDMVIFHEIYLDNEYRLRRFGPQNVVIDIGMNVGLASLFFAKDLNTVSVYGFEPFERTYKIALDNFGMNSKAIIEKIRHYNFALSNCDKKDTVNYVEDEPGNMSLVYPNDVNSQNDNIECEKVIVKDAGRVLKDIIEENNKYSIIVKCDCEGSEYEIFDSMERMNLIGKVSCFIIETHLGRGDELLKILDKAGFNYFAPVSRDGRMGMIYACK